MVPSDPGPDGRPDSQSLHPSVPGPLEGSWGHGSRDESGRGTTDHKVPGRPPAGSYVTLRYHPPVRVRSMDLDRRNERVEIIDRKPDPPDDDPLEVRPRVDPDTTPGCPVRCSLPVLTDTTGKSLLVGTDVCGPSGRGAVGSGRRSRGRSQIGSLSTPARGPPRSVSGRIRRRPTTDSSRLRNPSPGLKVRVKMENVRLVRLRFVDRRDPDWGVGSYVLSLLRPSPPERPSWGL